MFDKHIICYPTPTPKKRKKYKYYKIYDIIKKKK